MRKKPYAIILALILIFTLLCGTITAAAAEMATESESSAAPVPEIQTDTLPEERSDEAAEYETAEDEAAADEAPESETDPAETADPSEEIATETTVISNYTSEEPQISVATSGQQSNPLMVIIGDSYAEGYTWEGTLRPYVDSWAYQLRDRLGAPGSVVSCMGGTGFTNVFNGKNFSTLLREASYRVSGASVNLVVIGGGYNDQCFNQWQVYNDAVNTINLAKSLYPNARILVSSIGWQYNDATIQNRIRTVSDPAYQNAAIACGVEYWYGGEYVLANAEYDGIFDGEGAHPNLKGQNLLTEAFLRKLQNGNATNRITIRYHINDEWTDTKIIERTYYANGGGRLEQPEVKAGDQFAGWAFSRYARTADYSAYTPIANEWINKHHPVIDLYGVWKSTLNGTGIKRYNGDWYWVVNGQPQTSYTGFADYQGELYRIVNGRVSRERDVAYNPTDGNWYYTNNGKVDFSCYSVEQNANGWWRIENGKVNFNCNSVEANENGWWKITNGKVDFGFTGFERNRNGWWYLEKGRVTFKKNDVIYGRANNDASKAGENGWWLVRDSGVRNIDTVAKNAKGWWRIENGKVNFNCNSVEANENGWWKITNGKVDFGFTGFERNSNGWWYLEKGRVTFKKNDVIYGRANNDPSKAGENGWWLVRDSGVRNIDTVAKNAKGWWRIENGKVNFNCNSVEANENGWWKITNGKVDFGFTGFERNSHGWWYLEKGRVTFKKNDVIYGRANNDASKAGENGWWLVRDSGVRNIDTVAMNANGWWRIENGKVNFNRNSVEQNENGWWKITNGKVDFGFTGFARNRNGWWYLKNGKVDFKINGTFKGKANVSQDHEGVFGNWKVENSRVVKQVS